jgi:hypothetical protein
MDGVKLKLTKESLGMINSMDGEDLLLMIISMRDTLEIIIFQALELL